MQSSRLSVDNFNPRSPHGERQRDSWQPNLATLFQSTLPARGATASACTCAGQYTDFNPRSPHGERPHCRSPHGERRGSAVVGEQHIGDPIVAPRTGSDNMRVVDRAAWGRPHCRSPHGERPHGERQRDSWQPTPLSLPARGATFTGRRDGHGDFDPIVAPRTGSDGNARVCNGFSGDPIVAPRTGSDRKPVSPKPIIVPTPLSLPARGATAQSNNSVDQNHRLCTKSIPQNSPFEN